MAEDTGDRHDESAPAPHPPVRDDDRTDRERRESLPAVSTTDHPAGRDPAATVKRRFDAFGARDLDALLRTVHPESRWTYCGANPDLISWAEFTGHERVRRFFEGIVSATGQPFRNEWSQKYVVKDGLIVEMAEYNIQVEPRR